MLLHLTEWALKHKFEASKHVICTIPPSSGRAGCRQATGRISSHWTHASSSCCRPASSCRATVGELHQSSPGWPKGTSDQEKPPSVSQGKTPPGCGQPAPPLSRAAHRWRTLLSHPSIHSIHPFSIVNSSWAEWMWKCENHGNHSLIFSLTIPSNSNYSVSHYCT